jgi:hypothetical protein
MPIKANSQEQLNHDTWLLKINSENFQGNIQIVMRLINACLYILRAVNISAFNYPENPSIQRPMPIRFSQVNRGCQNRVRSTLRMFPCKSVYWDFREHIRLCCQEPTCGNRIGMQRPYRSNKPKT